MTYVYNTQDIVNADLIDRADKLGLSIIIENDEWGTNPRESFDYSSKFIGGNNNSSLFDDFVPSHLHGRCLEDAVNNYMEHKELDKKDIVWWAVYKYEHGNISLSTKPFSCRWDSGDYGFMYESRKELREEFGVKRLSQKLMKKIENRIESELKLMQAWANGEVYCLSLKKNDGDNEDMADYQSSNIYSEEEANIIINELLSMFENAECSA